MYKVIKETHQIETTPSPLKKSSKKNKRLRVYLNRGTEDSPLKIDESPYKMSSNCKVTYFVIKELFTDQMPAKYALRAMEEI